MRAPLRRAAASLLAAFCAASAAAALAPLAVVLVRPLAGEELVAGTEAVVEWRLLGPALDSTIEEWEAFLSFDGGGYYAVRLTPHLDVSHRRFGFEVPAIATDDARILLRFGDERCEVAIEIPHRFSIHLPAFAVVERGRRIPAQGEPARPGEPGVVAWVEGSRDGGELELFESYPTPSAGAAIFANLADPRPALTRRHTPAPARAVDAERVRRQRPPPRAVATSAFFPSIPILLLGCRRNE